MSVCKSERVKTARAPRVCETGLPKLGARHHNSNKQTTTTKTTIKTKIHPLTDEDGNHVGMAVGGGAVERDSPLAVTGVDVEAARHQKRHKVGLAGKSTDVDRALAVAVLFLVGVDHAGGKESLASRNVPLVGSRKQRGPPAPVLGLEFRASSLWAGARVRG